MMKADIKAEWVAALRSGEYKQTHSVLHRVAVPGFGDAPPEGYCCWGVLCDLAVKDGVAEENHTPGMYYTGFAVIGTGVWGGIMPPHDILEWAGLDHGEANVRIDDTYDNLATHNDGGKTFEQIADAIEASDF